MSAATRKLIARKLPLKQGLFRVSGVVLEGERHTDLLDVTSGPAGDLGVVVLDLSTPDSPEKLARSLAGIAARGFREQTPLHAVMLDLARGLLESGPSALRVTLLRCSAADARVEVTTAGMPPVACAHRDRHVTLHGLPAPPLTASSMTPPAVEFVPLTWGSSWLVSSDGFSDDLEPLAVVRRLAEELHLADDGAALAQLPPHALRGLLETRTFAATRPTLDDASVVVLVADPSARSHSGIQRGKSAL
ncbi:MAG TPA: SpoIIE family protein phosphatase [Polyangiaceae bacterium]|nr:SpoIIE family protein phosphatase [Polyangiaceae bacterium]